MPSAETTNTSSMSGTSDNNVLSKGSTVGTQRSVNNTNSTSNTQGAFNNVTNPYAPAESNLQAILQRAAGIAGNDQNFVPVQGATTQQGIQSLIDMAGQGSAAVNPLSSVVGSAVNGFNTGSGTLSNTASGGMLGQESPQLRAVLDRVASDTTNRVNQNFSAAGRYGSGNHAGAIAREVAGAENQALLGNYNQERSYQDQAAKTLYGGGFQGAGLAPQIDQSRLLTPELLGQAGSLQDAQANAEKMAPQQALQFLSGMTNPIAALGQSQSGTSSQNTSQMVQEIQKLLTRNRNNGTVNSTGATTQNGTQTQSTDNPMGTAIGIASLLGGFI